MAVLKLLDTGYVSSQTILASQNQLGVTDRAGYTGSTVTAISIEVLSITRTKSVKVENKPAVGVFETNVETSIISSTNPIYKISMIIPRIAITSGYNKNNIIQLARMEDTQGMKLIYPSVVDTILPTIIQTFGEQNKNGIFKNASPTDAAGTVGNDIPYLVGRCKNFSFTDNSQGKVWITVSFDFEVA